MQGTKRIGRDVNGISTTGLLYKSVALDQVYWVYMSMYLLLVT